MIALKIISLALSIAFTLFGYFIFFKKKYSLINGFDEAFKSGIKNKGYAKKVGLIEFIVGIAFLIATVMLFVFA